MSALRPAVFLDRDGTLMEEVHYCRDPALVRLFPGVTASLARLRAAGFALVIVTNQSGLGRGRITLPEYHAVHARLLELLHAEAAGLGNLPSSRLIDATYFCPDHPDQPSERRKPAPGMVLEAARDLGLDLARSWLIGDKPADVACAQNAGVRPILVRTGYGATTEPGAGVLVAEDLPAAADLILREAH